MSFVRAAYPLIRNHFEINLVRTGPASLTRQIMFEINPIINETSDVKRGAPHLRAWILSEHPLHHIRMTASWVFKALISSHSVRACSTRRYGRHTIVFPSDVVILIWYPTMSADRVYTSQHKLEKLRVNVHSHQTHRLTDRRKATCVFSKVE